MSVQRQLSAATGAAAAAWMSCLLLTRIGGNSCSVFG